MARQPRRALGVAEVVYAAAVATVWLAARFSPTTHPAVVVPATFLPYLVLPPVAAAVGWLCARRFRRALPGLAMLVLFLTLYGRQLRPWRGGDRRPADAVVMSYNVEGSKGGADAVAAVIGGARPQILALQEVFPPDEPDGLLALLDGRGYRCEQAPYYRRGRVGLAVCVQPPFRIVQATRRQYHRDGRWSYLFAELDDGERRWNVVVPHLLAHNLSEADAFGDLRGALRRVAATSSWHRQEVSALLRLIAGFADPTVMAGDFNSTPEQNLHARIRRHMLDAHRERGFLLGGTRRYFVPVRIDYVYASRDFEVVSARVGPGGASDHRPVIAGLRVRR